MGDRGGAEEAITRGKLERSGYCSGLGTNPLQGAYGQKGGASRAGGELSDMGMATQGSERRRTKRRLSIKDDNACVFLLLPHGEALLHVVGQRSSRQGKKTHTALLQDEPQLLE
jgi:hypothetical protein